MGMDASSPVIPQTYQDKGTFVVGSNVDMHDSAPDAVLFPYMWNFSPMFNELFYKIDSGALNDVDGKELVKAGETMDEQTVMDQNFFVSNVKGAQ